MTTARLLCVLALAALPAAGCGGDDDPVRSEDVPAITSPGTTIPYESGGADGAGSDGLTTPSDRGGIAAGRDVGPR